jgi:hypothetical protein
MDRFEVTTDRVGMRRWIRRMSWIHGTAGVVQAAALGALGGVLAFSLGSGDSDNAILYATLAGAGMSAMAFLLGLTTLSAGGLAQMRRRYEQTRVLLLDRDGLWMPAPRTPAGEIRLPWEAVGDVVVRPFLRHQIVTIKVRPHVTADMPGAVGLDGTVLASGLTLGTRFTDTDGSTVAAAVTGLRDRFTTGTTHPSTADHS